MPRYPGYRFAGEFHRHGRPVDHTLDASFLRVFRDEAGLLRAGLHPNAEPGDDDHWDDGTTLTAATETGARYAAIETSRLLIRDQEEATFTRME